MASASCKPASGGSPPCRALLCYAIPSDPLRQAENVVAGWAAAPDPGVAQVPVMRMSGPSLLHTYDEAVQMNSHSLEGVYRDCAVYLRNYLVAVLLVQRRSSMLLMHGAVPHRWCMLLLYVADMYICCWLLIPVCRTWRKNRIRNDAACGACPTGCEHGLSNLLRSIKIVQGPVTHIYRRKCGNFSASKQKQKQDVGWERTCRLHEKASEKTRKHKKI